MRLCFAEQRERSYKDPLCAWTSECWRCQLCCPRRGGNISGAVVHWHLTVLGRESLFPRSAPAWLALW